MTWLSILIIASLIWFGALVAVAWAFERRARRRMALRGLQRRRITKFVRSRWA